MKLPLTDRFYYPVQTTSVYIGYVQRKRLKSFERDPTAVREPVKMQLKSVLEGLN